MLKIYVGCCMNSASDEYLKEIADLKLLIKNELKCEVMEFIPKGTGTVEDVYENDIHYAVENCDIMIAEVSYPSLGLGWEMATAIEKLRKPVLMCAKEEASVSKLVQGACGKRNPKCAFVRYSKVEEIISKAKEIISNEK